MKWKLRELLEQHGKTPHQLALETKLSVNTVYPMARGEAERISLKTMDRVIAALREMTGQEGIDIGDILEYEET